MKICLDARWIFSEISGIGQYTRELIARYSELPAKDDFLLLFNDPLLMDRTVKEAGIAGKPHFEPVLFPHGVFSPASQLLLPRFLKRHGVSVYHSPNYMIPLLAFPSKGPDAMRCVTTIHDVIPLVIPGHAPRSRKARLFPLYRWVMREAGRRSDIIVTVSRTSADDIIRELRIPGEKAGKVRVVSNGVSSRFSPGPGMTPRQTRTILYVGRLDPYKNVTGLIRMFAQVRQSMHVPVELVIAGSPDPRYPEAIQLANELNLSSAIRWTGYLSDDELLSLYRDAQVLVHPSRYEGFGLQILEAMACGLPVVCSNIGALKEVAGDAAILLPPDDIDGFAREISRILTDRSHSDTLRNRGIENARRFSWDIAARQMLDIYQQAARL